MPTASACPSSRWSIPRAPIPGVDAEARGQAEAIARSTEACLRLGAPNIAVIIGEGGSGGAIAIATANRVYMLQHAIYSVISPEGAASILWRDSTRAQDAATAMKITATDLLNLKIIDGIVEEPLGGAHRDPDKVIDGTGEVIASALKDLAGLRPGRYPQAPPREIPRHRQVDSVGNERVRAKAVPRGLHARTRPW